MTNLRRTRPSSVYAECPSCGHTRATPTTTTGVQVCVRCECLHGRCYRGQSYDLVLPGMKDDGDLSVCKPFDLTIVGGVGDGQRRHGFYDPEDRRIVQAG